MSAIMKNKSPRKAGAPGTIVALLGTLILALVLLPSPQANAQAPADKPPAKNEVKGKPAPAKGGEVKGKPGAAPAKDERARRSRQPRGKKPPVDMPANGPAMPCRR